MVTAASDGLMDPPIRDSSLTITSTAEAFTCGQILESTMASGRTTRCTAAVSSHGLTAGNTKETTMMTRSRDEESSLGLMVASMMVIGSTANNMEKAFISLLRVKLREESGKKARELDGLAPRMNEESSLIILKISIKSLYLIFTFIIPSFHFLIYFPKYYYSCYQNHSNH
jgi:hypothetical protein